jgi:hypothetical protein
MNLPPPTVIRDFGSHLDQTPDQPLHSPFNLFAHEVKLPEHMQEVVGQHSHEQAGLVDYESMATRLVPPQGILPFLDPVLNIAATIVYLDQFPGRERGIGDNEPYAWEEFPLVPLDFRNHPTFLGLGLGLIPEMNQSNPSTPLTILGRGQEVLPSCAADK